MKVKDALFTDTDNENFQEIFGEPDTIEEYQLAQEYNKQLKEFGDNANETGEEPPF